jgi:hypothetical protein
MGETVDHPSSAVARGRTRDRRLLAVAGLSVLTLAATVGARAMNDLGRPDAEDAATVIVVGSPGGFVINDGTPPPATPEITASPRPSATASPVATAVPAAPPPATAAPATPPATPAPATPQPFVTPAPTPAPTTVVVAVAGPEDAVAAFYHHASAGEFDAAYALWSDRMRAAYPRTENVDERFDQTAEIRFESLYVAERSPTTAVVQANFTEIYDGGGSRAFVGYWELVLVDGRWLLDAPHY